MVEPLLRARVALSCLYCGHEVGDVDVPAGHRPSGAELRTAYAAAPDIVAPAWDGRGEPRCPRCAGKMFIEFIARSVRIYADDRLVRRAPKSEETEDAYAREDVYVPAGDASD